MESNYPNILRMLSYFISSYFSLFLQAVEHVKNIDHRLNGIMRQQKCTLQLSVEGQAHLLIQEATSIDNLSQMYIGWGAFI